MTLSISINIRDQATPAIDRLDSELQRDGVKHTAGVSVMRQIIDHLTTLDAERPNTLGGRRTHFYSVAGKSTHYDITDTGAIVSINHTGIAQRYFGGKIEREDGGPLTIPARAEAHGRRAREFSNLEILYGRNGPYALAERYATSFSVRSRHDKSGNRQSKIVNRKSVGGGIFFWLVKSVTQEPDPSVLPSEESASQNARDAIGRFIDSLVKKS